MERAFVATVLFTLAVASPARADANHAAIVVVRTFNYAQVPEGELAGARMTAARIFERAAIAITWIDCRVPGSDQGALCTEPLEMGRDLMLRLVDTPSNQNAGTRRALALGTSMLDRERREGVLMTVDLGPMREIAGTTSTEAGTLLGRAVAHEIGHMLLGTGEHARDGLMRALWTKDELRGLKPAHWQFSKHEAAQMRQGLALRTRATN